MNEYFIHHINRAYVDTKESNARAHEFAQRDKERIRESSEKTQERFMEIIKLQHATNEKNAARMERLHQDSREDVKDMLRKMTETLDEVKTQTNDIHAIAVGIK
jgi:hypothetical protein